MTANNALLRRAILGLCITLGLPGIAAGQARAETVLRYVPSAEPRTMDPVANFLSITQQHGYMVYDTLFSLDEKLVPQPQMVEGFTKSGDGRVYTMTLRPGLKFHDGSPVRSADAIASIRRWAARDPVGRKLTEMGMTLAVVDDRNFTITLEADTPLLLEGFAKPSAAALFVMREKEAQTDPMRPVAEVVGSGPFRFVPGEYRPGARMVYARNTDYVPRAEPASYFAGGKVVKVDRVEWIIMPDSSSAVAALQTGEIDIYETPPLDLLPVLERRRDVTVRVQGQQGQIGFLRPNFLHPPFNKPEGRRALALAMNQADAMAVTAGSDGKYWSRCYSFLACGGANEDQAGSEWMQSQRMDEARRLFQQAGYQGEPVVIIAPGDNEIIKSFGMLAAEQLRAAGLNVDLQLSDFASMMARRVNQGPPSQGGWNLFPMWSYSFEMDNPIANPTMNSACANPSGGYPGWSCAPQIDALRTAWTRETDPAKRREIIHQIQLASAEQVPIVLLGRFFSPMAYRSNLAGLLNTPLPVFWNISKP